MYYYSEGVDRDYKTVIKWYTLAAEQGYADAQYNLALMYFNSYGIQQDYVKALMWMNLAAANGAENASNKRRLIEKSMTPSQIKEAQRLAREWAGSKGGGDK